MVYIMYFLFYFLLLYKTWGAVVVTGGAGVSQLPSDKPLFPACSFTVGFSFGSLVPAVGDPDTSLNWFLSLVIPV